jgi:hypothetical protein
MSTSQEHTVPSVELVMRLCAFCVPTICIAYTGCVCPAAESGVLSTGRCFARVSQSRIWPEYVPPKTRLAWNGEHATDSTSDCEWKTNSGRSSRCEFQTATIPSGSFSAAGFLLYEATVSSGN